MANEARVTSGINISKGYLVYDAKPASFVAAVAGVKGPTPGQLAVSTSGTDVSFAQLASPGGLCRLMNLDATNYVTYGIWTGATFCQLGELLPGESYVLRLSRGLGDGAGHTLRLKANAAACNCLVEAFDK